MPAGLLDAIDAVGVANTVVRTAAPSGVRRAAGRGRDLRRPVRIAADVIEAVYAAIVDRVVACDGRARRLRGAGFAADRGAHGRAAARARRHRTRGASGAVVPRPGVGPPGRRPVRGGRAAGRRAPLRGRSGGRAAAAARRAVRLPRTCCRRSSWPSTTGPTWSCCNASACPTSRSPPCRGTTSTARSSRTTSRRCGFRTRCPVASEFMAVRRTRARAARCGARGTPSRPTSP